MPDGSPPLAGDTSTDIECLQVEGWRRMMPGQKLALVSALSMATRELALAGVMSAQRPADPLSVARHVTRALDALGIANTIGGSIASSIAGEPRSTIDIDIVAALETSHQPLRLDIFLLRNIISSCPAQPRRLTPSTPWQSRADATS